MVAVAHETHCSLNCFCVEERRSISECSSETSTPVGSAYTKFPEMWITINLGYHFTVVTNLALLPDVIDIDIILYETFNVCIRISLIRATEYQQSLYRDIDLNQTYDLYHITTEVRDSVVVKAQYYKPEGREFDSRWGEFLNLPNPSGRTRPWGCLLNL
jgi:hypothetical protein